MQQLAVALGRGGRRFDDDRHIRVVAPDRSEDAAVLDPVEVQAVEHDVGPLDQIACTRGEQAAPAAREVVGSTTDGDVVPTSFQDALGGVRGSEIVVLEEHDADYVERQLIGLRGPAMYPRVARLRGFLRLDA